MFLVCILSLHPTSLNAFVLGVQASQRSPKTPSTTIQLPNDSPAFESPPVPTGSQANNDRHFILNDNTSPHALTATSTVTMTQVPATTTAIMKATIKLVECFLHPTKTGANNATNKSESLLLHALFGSAITTARIHTPSLLLLYVHDNPPAIRTATFVQSFLLFCIKDAPAIMTPTAIHARKLLLPSARDDPAIMMATHTPYSLQLIVESLSTGAKQVASTTIPNDSFVRLLNTYLCTEAIYDS